MTTVYIIKNSVDMVYIGVTENINRRIMEHRDGLTISTNKVNTNWELLHSYEIPELDVAKKFESWLHKTFLSSKNRRPAWACKDLFEFILDCPIYCKFIEKQFI